MTELEGSAALVRDGGPLVTVAIPTYRRPNFLRSAIECALGQTYRNTEILVSDSEGSDRIADLVAGFGDPRLRYRCNDRLTTGLENAAATLRDARGEFIATLHDDDSWDPTFLEVMVAPLIRDPSLVLTFADHHVMNSNGEVMPRRTEEFTRDYGRAGLREGRYQPFARLALVDRAVFMVVATVLRNGVVDWGDIPREAGPPYELWMAYLACRDGGAAYYVPHRLSRYRQDDDCDSHASRLECGHVHTYDQALADNRLAYLRSDLLRASAPFRAGLGLTLLSEGDVRQARRHLVRALMDGSRASAGAGLALTLLPAPARERFIRRHRAARAHRRQQRYAQDRISAGGSVASESAPARVPSTGLTA